VVPGRKAPRGLQANRQERAVKRERGQAGRKELPEGQRRVSIGLRLDPEVYAWLEQESKATGISKAQLVDQCVRYFRGE
jgi:hypothetical protein